MYGNSNIYPSKETININKLLSIYGITKSSNEDLAYYYNFVDGISSIGLGLQFMDHTEDPICYRFSLKLF